MGLLATVSWAAGPIEVTSLLGSEGGVGELEAVCTLLGRLLAAAWLFVTMGEVEGLCKCLGESGCWGLY